MRTPLYEESPGSLQAWLLANKEAIPLDLWTITLDGGQVLRFTSGDVAVGFGGNTYSMGPIIERGDTKMRMGVAVDTLSMQITPRDTDMVGSVPMMAALSAGLFDGAEIALWRLFMDLGGVVRGVLPEFLGTAGDIRTVGLKASIQVRSWLELLNVSVPGNVYQAGCRRTLYDAGCGVSRSAFTVSGTLSATADATKRIHTSTSAAVIAKPSAWGSIGVLRFTSGANTGVARPVRVHSLSAGTATITTIYGFPFQAQAGDSFELQAGCDKRKTTCGGKFSNSARFSGEPYIPAPETVT
jgi:uncharacterized phage protein (TIGR02218 family)